MDEDKAMIKMISFNLHLARGLGCKRIDNSNKTLFLFSYHLNGKSLCHNDIRSLPLELNIAFYGIIANES